MTDLTIRPATRQGIFILSMADYLTAPGVNKSLLDKFAECPLVARRHMDAPVDDPSDAMRLGALVDAAIFYPSKFAEMFAWQPAEYPGQHGEMKPWHNGASRCKSWRDEQTLPIATLAERKSAEQMANAVLAEPLAKCVLSNGTAQASVFAVDQASGLQIKGRPDYHGNRCAADLKKLRDVSPRGISKAIAAYRLHVQAAIYTDLLQACGQECNTFYFVCVEDHPNGPLVNVVSLAQQAIELGRSIYQQQLIEFAECLASGKWPGYTGETIPVIDLPPWCYKTGDSGEVQHLLIGGEKYSS